MFEVGEGSLAGEGGSAQASLMIEHKSGVSAQCAMPLLEADALFYVSSSSDELMLSSGVADGPFFVGTSSDELMLSLGKADGPFYAGTSSDELKIGRAHV